MAIMDGDREWKVIIDSDLLVLVLLEPTVSINQSSLSIFFSQHLPIFLASYRLKI